METIRIVIRNIHLAQRCHHLLFWYLVLSFDKKDYNNKNLKDEDSIVVYYDEVSFTLGIAINGSFNDIELLLFESFPLFYSSSLSLS